MKDAESDDLNGDCSASYHLEVPKKNGCKTPKCMDDEFHASSLDTDDIDNENSRSFIINVPPKEEYNKKTESAQIDESSFDSDEDTFADAESDCEPNQFFLDEMLEDEHPERLNLFDYRKKEQEKGRGGSTKTLSSFDSQKDENDLNASVHNKLIRNLNIDSDSDSDPESDTEDSDDEHDSFGNLPTIRKKVSRGRLSMGTSPGVGPGRSMLRQASQKAVWGK